MKVIARIVCALIMGILLGFSNLQISQPLYWVAAVGLAIVFGALIEVAFSPNK